MSQSRFASFGRPCLANRSFNASPNRAWMVVSESAARRRRLLAHFGTKVAGDARLADASGLVIGVTGGLGRFVGIGAAVVGGAIGSLGLV